MVFRSFCWKMIHPTCMSNKVYRVVLVNYLNTLPFLKGISQVLGNQCELILAHPADCARILFSGEADYGLVPVGALMGRSDWRRVTDYGIACNGNVDTVCLFGNSPMADWTRVYLDYQSRTSVKLTEALLADYWQKNVELIPATPGYESRLNINEGALIIGDRAIEAASQFTYHYDLGQAWKIHTGLPFVFAVWVSTGAPDPVFESALNHAFEAGQKQKSELTHAHQNAYPTFDLDQYFNKTIHYKLDAEMVEGLNRFLMSPIVSIEHND